MFGAIPASLILDIARAEGCMYQLPLFRTPPRYEIKEEYVCSVFNGWKCVDNGTGGNSETGEPHSGGIISHQDHPAFTALRNHLENEGYIKTERGWSNGDRVTSPFYLNDFLFFEGEKFPCAGAMYHKLFNEKSRKRNQEETEKLVYTPVKVSYNNTMNKNKDEW